VRQVCYTRAVTPIETSGEPPSGGAQRPSDPSIGSGAGADATAGTVTGGIAQPISGAVARSRSQTWFGESGALRRFVTRWGFPLFVLLILFLGREVLLPFVFAGLIAYILTPVVHWMVDRADGTRRMPRGLAIVACYLVFISLVAGFLFLLVPRLSRDVARLGKEAPGLYKRINEEWTPEVAHWLEGRFPSLSRPKPAEDPRDATRGGVNGPASPVQPPEGGHGKAPLSIEEPAPAPEHALPAGTAFTMTPLPDGGYAMQLAPNGIDVKPQADGSFHIQTNETRPEPASLEDKLRSFVKRTLLGLQDKLNDVVRLGQSLIVGFIRGIFLFFFTLMIGAFVLIDLEKVHSFLRSLFPANVRDDYDVIIAGIDRGLSGVIRGQLVICVINSLFTYAGLLTFGVKYKLILAVVAGVMSLVPIFGSILSSVPIVLVALVSGDEGIDIFRGVAMTLWIVGIHFIEANVLNPKIIGTAAKIHPVLVIFSLFLGEHAFGLVGALLAVPVLSAISVVFMYLYRKAWKDLPRTTGRGSTGPLSKPPDPGSIGAPPT
jgi:predicted PurR-regulated permease PerM